MECSRFAAAGKSISRSNSIITTSSTVADSPSGCSFSRSVTHRFRNNCSIAVRSGLLMESSSIWSIYLYLVLLFSHFQNNHYSLNRYIHVEGAGPRHASPLSFLLPRRQKNRFLRRQASLRGGSRSLKGPKIMLFSPVFFADEVAPTEVCLSLHPTDWPHEDMIWYYYRYGSW
jgi:hypothetical protein